jgi:hypothetical protein
MIVLTTLIVLRYIEGVLFHGICGDSSHVRVVSAIQIS